MARKMEKKFDISDDAIGVVSIRKGGKVGQASIYFDIATSKEIEGREVKFNKKEMSMKVSQYEGGGHTPTKYGENYSLYISVPVDFGEYGYYEMVWEDERYKLYKIE